MKKSLLAIFAIFALFNVAQSQCGIEDCPNGFTLTYDNPFIVGESIQINNVYPQNYTCLLSDSFKIGNFGAGIDFYVFQLLPDGTRMNNCHVLNDYPNNVVAKTEAVNSAGDFCGFPFGSFDITLDDTKGFIPCDGGIYEIVAATWVDSLGLGTTVDAGELPRTVYDVWPGGNGIYFQDTVMATLTFDLNGGFTAGVPNTTAILKQWGSNATGTIMANCTDVDLYVEAMSTIANCPPFLDITTGITSELENELYFTINNGPAIDVLTDFNPQGGILTGPDSLLNGNCYAGIYTENAPTTIPLSQFNLCEEDTVRVYLTTTDLFTGITESDELTILFIPAGCGNCAPPCNFTVNATFDCATEELCVSNLPPTAIISWGPDTEFSGTNPTSICNIVSPNFSTNYVVDVVDIYGCGASDIINVGYNGNVDAGLDVQIFDGDAIPLQASLPGATSFVWVPSNGLSSSTIANPIANPTTTTTYEVTAINANGCVSVDEIEVTVFPTNALVFDIGNDIGLCDETEPLNINANFFPFTTCVWTLPDGTQIADCEINLANPILGNYVCDITDTITSQVGVDSINVAIDTTQVDAGEDLILCAGAFAQLNASTPNVASYVWSGGNLSNLNIPNPTFVASTSVTYTITATTFNGCVSTDNLQVSIEELIIDAGADFTICEGGTANLDATSPNIDTYQWLGDVSDANIANPFASPTLTTTYTVFGSNSNGCNAQDEITVFVSGNLTLDAGNDITIEYGENALTNITTNDFSADITWFPTDGLSCTTCPNPIASPSVTTTYLVTVNDGICQTSDEITITVNLPDAILEASSYFDFMVQTDNSIFVNSSLNINSIYLSDLNGKIIVAQDQINQSSFLLKTHNLNAGIYFARILSEENWYVKKLFLK